MWRPLDIGANNIKVPNIPVKIRPPRLSRIGGLAGIAQRESPTRGMATSKQPFNAQALMKAASPKKRFAPGNIPNLTPKI
jgi:hypothetical protein